MKRPRSLQTSPINQPDRWPAKAVALAVALHTPYFLNSRCGEAWEERDNIVHAAKEAVKSTLISRPLERDKYIRKLKEGLENGASVDLGEFYLRTEYIEGRIDEVRMKESLKKLASAETELRAEMEEKGVIKTLKAITESQGGYSEPNSYLSSAVDDKKGNCQAREKYTAALVQRLYPDAKIAYQNVKVEGEMHTRTLVEIDGQWHNMENPEAPMTDKELEGTVLYDKYDYVRNYAGEKPIGEYRKRPDTQTSEKTHTKLTATDDYLHLPLPEGVSTEDIACIGGKDSPAKNNVPSAADMNTIDIVPMVELNSHITQESKHERGEFAAWDWRGSINSSDFTIDADALQYLKDLSTTDDEGMMQVLGNKYPHTTQNCRKSLILPVRLNIDNILRHCWQNETTRAVHCYYEQVWWDDEVRSTAPIYFEKQRRVNQVASLLDAEAKMPDDIQYSESDYMERMFCTSVLTRAYAREANHIYVRNYSIYELGKMGLLNKNSILDEFGSLNF